MTGIRRILDAKYLRTLIGYSIHLGDIAILWFCPVDLVAQAQIPAIRIVRFALVSSLDTRSMFIPIIL